MKKYFLSIIVLLFVFILTGCSNNYYGCYDSDDLTMCLDEKGGSSKFYFFKKDAIKTYLPNTPEARFCTSLKKDQDACKIYGMEWSEENYYIEETEGYLNVNKNNEFIISDLSNTDGVCEIKSKKIICSLEGKETVFKKNKNELKLYKESTYDKVKDKQLVSDEEYNKWLDDNTYCKEGDNDKFNFPDSINNYTEGENYFDTISKTYTEEYFNGLSSPKVCVLFVEKFDYAKLTVYSNGRELIVREYNLNKN